MTSFAQGQPFSSGPIWDQMRFGGEQTTGTIPIAGSYMSDFISFASNPDLAKLPEDMRGFAVMGGILGMRDLEQAKRSEAMADKYLAYQERASERANEMGIRNQIIGSFLKDVPAAIGGAFRARNAYLPEQIQIAAAGAGRGIPSVASPNYYGFVR